MAALTDMEARAIQESRAALWEGCVAALGEPKALEVFGELSEQAVDSVIEKVWDALRASMRGQSARGAVPF